MKYHALFVILKKRQNLNCRLLQLVDGALRVNFGISPKSDSVCHDWVNSKGD